MSEDLGNLAGHIPGYPDTDEIVVGTAFQKNVITKTNIRVRAPSRSLVLSRVWVCFLLVRVLVGHIVLTKNVLQTWITVFDRR